MTHTHTQHRPTIAPTCGSSFKLLRQFKKNSQLSRMPLCHCSITISLPWNYEAQTASSMTMHLCTKPPLWKYGLNELKCFAQSSDCTDCDINWSTDFTSGLFVQHQWLTLQCVCPLNSPSSQTSLIVPFNVVAFRLDSQALFGICQKMHLYPLQLNGNSIQFFICFWSKSSPSPPLVCTILQLLSSPPLTAHFSQESMTADQTASYWFFFPGFYDTK